MGGQPYWESLADRRIREAMERGEFDDLKGAGKPLPNLDKPYDPDWWINDLVQRENLDLSGAMHPTLALRREAQRMPDEVRDLPSEEAVRRVVAAFNRRVLEDRLRPATGTQMPPIAKTVDADEMVEHWRAAHAEREEQRRAQREAAEQAERQRIAALTPARRWWEGRRRRG